MSFQTRTISVPREDISASVDLMIKDTRSELVKTIERLEQEHNEAARQLGEIKATISINYGPNSPIHVDVHGQSIVASVVDVFRKYEAKQRELIGTIEQMRKEASVPVRSFESGQSWIDKTGRYVRLVNRIEKSDSWTAMVIGLCSAPDVVVHQAELVTLL